LQERRKEEDAEQTADLPPKPSFTTKATAEFFQHTDAEVIIVETSGLNVERLTTFSRAQTNYLTGYKELYM
jgi:hypothetical protein